MIKYIPVRFDTEGKVICELCEKSFNKLGAHIRMHHHTLTSNYRKQFGLNSNEKLMSNTSIVIARKNILKNKNKCIKENLIIKGKNTRFKRGWRGRPKDKITPQTMERLKQESFIKKLNNL